MTFVRGYDHDLFVSYAHLDNQGESAWVTTLVGKLETEVRQRLGTKEFRIWIDDELDGNRPLTPEIMESLRRSATLLIVMSPAYLASEWCAKERTAFLTFVRDCVAEGRIFIVHCRETERKDIPPEFGDLVGFKFWTKDPKARATRPLGWPDQREGSYMTKILNVSDTLARALKEMNAAHEAVALAVPSGITSERIFLAHSTDDMEAREEELGYSSDTETSMDRPFRE